VEMGVLQVVLGDASTAEARSGKKPTDEEVEKMIRKTMLGNQETLTILEVLKSKLTEARKAGRSAELPILQVVLGEASTAEARSGKAPSDEEVEKIIRKTMLGNQETMGLMKQHGRTGDEYTKLEAENTLLQTFLPKTLSVAEIVAELAAVADAIKGAKSDGQATGVAMKHLKGRGLKVLGDDVTAAVKQVRG